MRIYIANLGKYNEGILQGGWIELPVDELTLREFLRDTVGINAEYEEFAIHDYECSYMEIGEYENLDKLNEIAEMVEDLDENEVKKLEAIMEWGYYSQGTDAVIEALENIDDFNLMEDVENDKDLGEYMAEVLGIQTILEEHRIDIYFDYEQYGSDMDINSEGMHTQHGYIEKH